MTAAGDGTSGANEGGLVAVCARQRAVQPSECQDRRAIALDAHSVQLLTEQKSDADRIAGMFGHALAATAPVFANARGEPW